MFHTKYSIDVILKLLRVSNTMRHLKQIGHTISSYTYGKFKHFHWVYMKHSIH